jgi:inorganic phosphate transporter, PiT family
MGNGWFIAIVSLTFFLAWNLGANDVANAMGTSVGSKALTLRKAIVLAGILEFAGAVLFGREVTATLTTQIVASPALAAQPQILLSGVIAQLLAISLWLALATRRGWPVASSHAAVGAITGINVLTWGWAAFRQSGLGFITLGWVLTPVVSGSISAIFFLLLQRVLLKQPQPLERWQHWQPWLSSMVVALVGGLIFPTLVIPIAHFAQQQWGWSWPHQTYGLALGVVSIGILGWWTATQAPAPKQSEQDTLESQFGKFQVVSASCMAFAHGSNDVGNAIAPLVSALTVWGRPSTVPSAVTVPLWVLILGGVGIVVGLALWGRRVMGTVGEQLIPLKPSYGFCAELGAATTVLLASHWGLPVSTTHALVGSVVGIGLTQGAKTLNWSTVRQIAAAWIITTPAAMVLGAAIFWGLQTVL